MACNHREINTTKLLNIPNILTLSRIVLLPGFICGFYIRSQCGLTISFVIFIICCITDYLDGYLARSYNQITEIGKMLDPLADKILICIALLFLSGFDMLSQASLIPSAITICRELFITSMRSNSIANGKKFCTSYISKCKTTIQMISISTIFLAYIFHYQPLSVLGELLLWCSTIIALFSGIKYFKKFNF